MCKRMGGIVAFGFGLVVGFFGSCLSAVSRRGFLFAVMNSLFFVSLLLAVFFFQLQQPPPRWGSPKRVPEFLVGFDWPLLIVAIFLFNMVLSGFVMITLPGLLFFPLSAITLLFRGYLWGLYLSQLATPHFLAVLPTIVLEGEGYVTASVAGILLGLSWVKPDWTYEKASLPRLESLKKALKECAHLYLLAAGVLLAAAVVEVATIQFYL